MCCSHHRVCRLATGTLQVHAPPRRPGVAWCAGGGAWPPPRAVVHGRLTAGARVGPQPGRLVPPSVCHQDRRRLRARHRHPHRVRRVRHAGASVPQPGARGNTRRGAHRCGRAVRWWAPNHALPRRGCVLRGRPCARGCTCQPLACRGLRGLRCHPHAVEVVAWVRSWRGAGG